MFSSFYGQPYQSVGGYPDVWGGQSTHPRYGYENDPWYQHQQQLQERDALIKQRQRQRAIQEEQYRKHQEALFRRRQLQEDELRQQYLLEEERRVAKLQEKRRKKLQIQKARLENYCATRIQACWKRYKLRNAKFNQESWAIHEIDETFELPPHRILPDNYPYVLEYIG